MIRTRSFDSAHMDTTVPVARETPVRRIRSRAGSVGVAMGDVGALNERAVVKMRDFLYKEAVGELQMALRRILTDVQLHEKAIETRDGPNNEDDSLRLVSVAVVPESLDLRLKKSAYYIYGRAFLFTVKDGETVTRTYSRLNIVICTLIYNLGIAHHLMALHGLPRQHLFQRALGLYDTAIGILHNCQLPTVDRRFGILKLAVHNNKGHIHSLQFDDENVKRCMNIVRTVLARYSPTDDSNLSDCVNLHMNVVLFRNGLCIPFAPAA